MIHFLLTVFWNVKFVDSFAPGFMLDTEGEKIESGSLSERSLETPTCTDVHSPQINL